MKILIITGGSSSERKISLRSAAMVKKALQSNGHEVVVFDFLKGYAQLKKILPEFDLIFPVMHGKEGEDGTLYQFLRTSKKAYVGSNPAGAKTAFDKILFKKYCDANKISTAAWKTVKDPSQIIKFGFPCVLKGAYGGSSNEVILLNSKKDLTKSKTKKLLSSDNNFFVEKMLRGCEVTVGVLFDKPLPVIEIVPPKKGWFDYKNKYSGKTKEIAFAPSVSLKLQNKLKNLARKIHRDLKLGSFSRTDIIIESGIPYVMEINTPGGVGLTDQSLFPKAAKAIGIPFEALIQKLAEKAVGRTK